MAYRYVNLNGRIPGKWYSSNGRRAKTTAPVVHYNGPPTGVRTNAQAVRQLYNDAAYHMRPGIFEPKAQNGIQYHYAVFNDVVYLLRDPRAVLWHCGHRFNYTSPAVHVPIGQGERANARTIQTLIEFLNYLNNSWGLNRKAISHFELSSTSCPGTLHKDFVVPYRTGRFGNSPPPKPAPEPTPKPSPDPSTDPSPRKKQRKVKLQRINVCYKGSKDRRTAKAFRVALNAVARQRGMKDVFAQTFGGGGKARYAATQAWNDSKNDYTHAVLIGGPIVKELDGYMRKALSENDHSGRVIAANGRGWADTNEIASWRLAYVCDELGFGQSEKDFALRTFKDKLNLKASVNSKPDKPKPDNVQKPDRAKPDKPKKDSQEMMEKVEKGIDALEARLGSFYNAWKSGDGWTGTPIWGDRLPTVAECRSRGGVCSTALNIVCHINGIDPPDYGGFKGGTGAWGVYGKKYGEPFPGAGTWLKRGDIVGSPYKGAKLSLQGHVAVVISDGLPKDAKVIQWDLFAGNGQPGLNKYRTVASTNTRLSNASKWSYIIRRETLFG